MKLQRLQPRLATAPQRIRTATPGDWRTEKTSSTARGYGYKWQQARARFLSAHPWCVMCLAECGITAIDPTEQMAACMAGGFKLPPANVVDHKVPHRGNMQLFWDSANWQPLCATHHSRDKQREERGY